MKLKDQVAIVTGASRGIGKHIAVQLAEEGASIVLAARTVRPGESPYPGTIEEAAAEVEKRGGKALPLKCDLIEPQETELMCLAALEKFGHVDIFVHNAFFKNDNHYSPLLEVRRDSLRDALTVSTIAPLVAIKTVLPEMIKNRRGIILFVTSKNALVDTPGLPGKGSTSVVYIAAKGAEHRFAQALSKETGVHNIPAILIDPGACLTERVMQDSTRQGGFDTSGWHSPEVPARAVRYLCTCPDPMLYNGMTIDSATFIQEMNLVSKEELATYGLRTDRRPNLHFDMRKALQALVGCV